MGEELGGDDELFTICHMVDIDHIPEPDFILGSQAQGPGI